MATSAPVQFVVVSALLEGSPTHVDRLELVEALDEPYAAELWLRIHDTSIDVVALLGEDLVVTMQRGDQERRICGLVRSVSEGAPNPETSRPGSTCGQRSGRSLSGETRACFRP